MLRQIKCWLQNEPITKSGVLPVTTLFFWKNFFSLRTSYKDSIWCTNNPNTHIHTFCKRWSFIWRYFFPVSILKFAYYPYVNVDMTICWFQLQNRYQMNLSKDNKKRYIRCIFRTLSNIYDGIPFYEKSWGHIAVKNFCKKALHHRCLTGSSWKPFFIQREWKKS